MLLLGMALAIWTAAGAAAVYLDPTVQMPSRTKRPRLSLARVGIYWLRQIRNTVFFGVEFVRSYLPPPSLRFFDWLSPDAARAAA